MIFSLLLLSFQWIAGNSDVSLATTHHFGRDFWNYAPREGSLNRIVHARSENGTMYAYFETDKGLHVANWQDGTWQTWVDFSSPPDSPHKLPDGSKGCLIFHENTQNPLLSGYVFVTANGTTSGYEVFPMVSPVQMGVGEHSVSVNLTDTDNPENPLVPAIMTVNFPSGRQVIGIVYNKIFSGTDRCHILFRDPDFLFDDLDSITPGSNGVLGTVVLNSLGRSCLSVEMVPVEEGSNEMLTLVAYNTTSSSAIQYDLVIVELTVDPATNQLTSARQVTAFSSSRPLEVGTQITSFSLLKLKEKEDYMVLLLGTRYSIFHQIGFPILERQNWLGMTTTVRKVSRTASTFTQQSIYFPPDSLLGTYGPITQSRELMSSSDRLSTSYCLLWTTQFPSVDIQNARFAVTVSFSMPSVSEGNFDSYYIRLSESSGIGLSLRVYRRTIQLNRVNSRRLFPNEAEFPSLTTYVAPEDIMSVTVYIDTKDLEVHVNNGMHVASFEYFLANNSDRDLLLPSLIYPDTICVQGIATTAITDARFRFTYSSRAYRTFSSMNAYSELVRDTLPSFEDPAPEIHDTPSGTPHMMHSLATAIYLVLLSRFISASNF